MQKLIACISFIAAMAQAAPAQQTANERLIEAARRGDARSVRAELQRGADPNADDGAPLRVAAYGESLPSVRALLQAGADPRHATKWGKTALMDAAIWGNVGIAKALLRAGADVNASDHEKSTALSLAAERGYTRLAELLVASGASIDQRHRHGMTALHISIERSRGLPDSNKMPLLLLRLGADPSITDDAGTPVLHYAAEAGLVGVARQLLAQGVKPAANAAGEMPLHWLTGADGSGRGHGDHRLASGCPAMARLLIKAGEPIDATLPVRSHRGPAGATPLYLAARRLDGGLAATLVALGADVNTRTASGDTPLMEASRNLSRTLPEVGQLLLEAGAEVDARDGTGMTPLMHAAAAGNRARAEELLARGATIGMLDAQGRSAMDWAVLNGRRDVVVVLSRSGAELKGGFTALIDAAERGDTATISRLSERSAALDRFDDTGLSPIQHAAAAGHVDAVRLLLDLGADPRMSGRGSPRSYAAWTPTALVLAARNGHASTVALLIERERPLEYELGEALLAGSANESVARVLLAACANPDYRTEYGSRPLLVATERGCAGCVRALLEAGADATAHDDSFLSALALSSRSAEIRAMLFAHLRLADDDTAFDAIRIAVFQDWLARRASHQQKDGVALYVENHKMAPESITGRLPTFSKPSADSQTPTFTIESIEWLAPGEVRVSTSHWCGLLCGYGEVLLVRLVKSTWVVVDRKGTWVS